VQSFFKASLILTAVILVTACNRANSTTDPPGSISGRILFKTQDTSLRVYAREVNTGKVSWMNLGGGNFSYTFPGLPAGTYVIVGWLYPMGASGAYTALALVVADGAEAMRACREALLFIELSPGEAYSGADIGCWGGDFFDLVE